MNQTKNRSIVGTNTDTDADVTADVDVVIEKPLHGNRVNASTKNESTRKGEVAQPARSEQRVFPPYPNAVANREKHGRECIQGIHNLFWNRHSSKEFGIPVRAYRRDSVKHPDTFIMLSDVGDHGQTGFLGGSIFYTEEEALKAARDDMIAEMSLYESKIKDIDKRLTILSGLQM